MAESDTDLHIPWRRVALGGILVSITCLSTLAVVATVRGANALSTIALALSILSFTSQLVIFTIQAWTSTQQLRQSESLNTQTNALVSEVRADVAGTKSLMTDHFKDLLQAAITKSIPEAEKAAAASNASVPGDQVAELLTGLEQALDRAATQSASHSTPVTRSKPRSPSPEDERVIQMMSTWPDETETREVLDIWLFVMKRGVVPC